MGRHANQPPVAREFLSARADRFLWEIAEETGLDVAYLGRLFKQWGIERHTGVLERNAVEYIKRHRFMAGADLARRLGIRVPELRRMFEAIGIPYRARESADGTPEPLRSRECWRCPQENVCRERTRVGARLLCEGILNNDTDQELWRCHSAHYEVEFPARVLPKPK